MEGRTAVACGRHGDEDEREAGGLDGRLAGWFGPRVKKETAVPVGGQAPAVLGGAAELSAERLWPISVSLSRSPLFWFDPSLVRSGSIRV